jgi:hypothetical protein
LILSTRRRIPVALVATLRWVVALRPALVPVAVSLAVALLTFLTFLTALLSTRILRTTLVLVSWHVSIPTLLVSLIWLSHWFLLGRLHDRQVRSKLGAELITHSRDGSKHRLRVNAQVPKHTTDVCGYRSRHFRSTWRRSAIETDFFERADMPDTKVGQSEKDDPAAVATVSFDAMMRGDGGVLRGGKISCSPRTRT